MISDNLVLKTGKNFAQNSAANVVPQFLYAFPSVLLNLIATNTLATAAYLKLYDRSTAAVVGTTVPAVIIAIPGLSTISIPMPLVFENGISLVITNLPAYTDVTPVAAFQVFYKFQYII